MNNFVITIRRPYTNRIILRTKKFEIRTRIPKDLEKGSKIYVVESGTKGEVLLSFIVGNIIKIQPINAWLQYGKEQLGMSLEDFRKNAENKPIIYLIEITNIETFYRSFHIWDMSIKQSPVWFTRVK